MTSITFSESWNPATSFFLSAYQMAEHFDDALSYISTSFLILLITAGWIEASGFRLLDYTTELIDMP
jgi:hypothetical protein